jgi:hypothetical protein
MEFTVILIQPRHRAAQSAKTSDISYWHTEHKTWLHQLFFCSFSWTLLYLQYIIYSMGDRVSAYCMTCWFHTRFDVWSALLFLCVCCLHKGMWKRLAFSILLGFLILVRFEREVQCQVWHETALSEVPWTRHVSPSLLQPNKRAWVRSYTQTWTWAEDITCTVMQISGRWEVFVLRVGT